MKGPRLKKIRRLGTPLPGLTRKEPKEGGAAPGAHRGRRPPRKSGYRVQLEEKQKIRWHYGVSESQLRRIFEQATREPGSTGEALLSLLERRLDNVVFRLGLAPTIPAARQLVAHGHVRVDGTRVDRANYRVQPGQEISLAERSREIPDVLTAVERGPEVRLPSYLAIDPDDRFAGRVVASPARSDVPVIVDETAIVEFYAR